MVAVVRETSQKVVITMILTVGARSTIPATVPPTPTSAWMCVGVGVGVAHHDLGALGAPRARRGRRGVSPQPKLHGPRTQ